MSPNCLGSIIGLVIIASVIGVGAVLQRFGPRRVRDGIGTLRWWWSL